MIFSGYNPFPKKQDDPEIPAPIKIAARLAGATHLSSDGSMAYMLRMGKFCWADWNGRNYGRWWSNEAEKIPDGAIEL